MVRKNVYIALAALVGSLALLIACSSGISEEEADQRVADAVSNATEGMMTEAQAQAMVDEATANMDGAMSDDEIMAAAEGMGMMMADDMDGMMSDDEIMAAAMDMGMVMADDDAMDGGMMMMSSERVAAIQDRGTVVCAGNNSLTGFGFIDDDGNTVGFDIDLCRAVAVAVLGDADAIDIRPTTAAERGPSMQSGEVDIMSRNTTWTTTRDATWGNFAQTMFYDGQGFMIKADYGVNSAMELQGAKICVQQGTTTELNVEDFNRQNNMDFDFVTFADNVGANNAYLSGQCDALTTDRSGLVATRSGFDNPDDHLILPETISEEPLGPVVPHGDEQWYDIVKTVMAILIYAEAFEIDSMNVPTSATGNKSVDRMLGFENDYGQEALGLNKTVAQDIIKAVGNYGEIYDRHLTPLGLTREGSRNALWSSAPCMSCPKGGQVYAAPPR